MTGTNWTWGYPQPPVPETKGFLLLQAYPIAVGHHAPLPWLSLWLLLTRTVQVSLATSSTPSHPTPEPCYIGEHSAAPGTWRREMCVCGCSLKVMVTGSLDGPQGIFSVGSRLWSVLEVVHSLGKSEVQNQILYALWNFLLYLLEKKKKLHHHASPLLPQPQPSVERVKCPRLHFPCLLSNWRMATHTLHTIWVWLRPLRCCISVPVSFASCEYTETFLCIFTYDSLVSS